MIHDWVMIDSPPIESRTPYSISREVIDRCRERFIKGVPLTQSSKEESVPVTSLRYYCCREKWGKLKVEYQERKVESQITPPPTLTPLPTGMIRTEDIPIPTGLSQEWYQVQVERHRLTAETMLDEVEKCKEEVKDKALSILEKVSLRKCIVALSERAQEVLSIPSVRPMQVREKRSGPTAPAIPV